MTDIDVLIIGGGIVGFACAREFALRKPSLSVVVIDKSLNPGDGISGRNSGVLHAGIYYKTGSRKAYHCIIGNRITHELTEKWNVPILKCGKFITNGVSDNKEDRQRKENLIEHLLNKATENGATGLSLTADLPSGVQGSLAIHSKNTSVIDAAAYLKAMRTDAERNGVMFLPGRWIDNTCEIKEDPGISTEVQVQSKDGIEIIRSSLVINAAGIYSDELATITGLSTYSIRPVRGEYYALKKPILPFLVYPLPDPQSTALGVHYTIHPSGEAYAGPNAVMASSKEDYQISATAEDFHSSLSRIVNGYSVDDLIPGYSGLRPRLHLPDGSPVYDFTIERTGNWIHLLGIESPGLTSAVSLATEVYEMADLN